jgi:hypothetical protein
MVSIIGCANFFLVLVGIVTLLHYALPIINKTIGGVKEGLTSVTPIPTVCGDNECPAGCAAPKELSGNCPATIYQDGHGGHYRRCPYECDNALDKCGYDQCCHGCGTKKFKIDENGNPISPAADAPTHAWIEGGSSAPKDESTGITTHLGTEPIAREEDGAPPEVVDVVTIPHSPTHAPTTPAITQTLDKNMTSVDADPTEHNKGSEFTRQYPCRSTITGAFTDCGPRAANMACYATFNKSF